MGDISLFDISNVLQKCNLECFCETGTLHGDAVNFISNFPFKQIISIEIVNTLAEAAAKRFEKDERIKIVHGDSSKVLKSVCDTYLNGNTLFWLDAHFPGADSHITKYGDERERNTRIPLQSELEIIKARCEVFKDVIIIDDLWLYEEGPFEWGTFNDHMKRYHLGERREDICGEDSSFVYKMFDKTHDIKIVNNHQGYLILTPKKT